MMIECRCRTCELCQGKQLIWEGGQAVRGPETQVIRFYFIMAIVAEGLPFSVVSYSTTELDRLESWAQIMGHCFTTLSTCDMPNRFLQLVLAAQSLRQSIAAYLFAIWCMVLLGNQTIDVEEKGVTVFVTKISRCVESFAQILFFNSKHEF